MMEKAHVNWTVGLQRVYIRDMRNTDERSAIEVPSARAIVRLSDSKPLGIATDNYKETQNIEKFATFEKAIDGRAVWRSMGSLKEGSMVYGLAEIPGDWKIADEEHKRYLLALGYHDGKTADHFLCTNVRVECNNTASFAVSSAKHAKGELAKGIRVVHRGDVQGKLAEVSDTFERALGDFNGYKERMEALTAVKMSRDEQREILEQILDGDSSRSEKARETIMHLAYHGKGNAPVAGTAYGLLQGTTEYVDNYRMLDTTPERRFFYQTDGAGSRLKQRMEATLTRELTAVNDTSGVDGAAVLADLLAS